MEEKTEIRSFEDLECWKACVEVKRYISIIVKNFPDRKITTKEGKRLKKH